MEDKTIEEIRAEAEPRLVEAMGMTGDAAPVVDEDKIVEVKY